MPAYHIPEAHGASIRPADLLKDRFFPITDFGASTKAGPVPNTRAINDAVCAAAREGGTVVVPPGTFLTYTILLKSNVNLFLEEGAVLAAAKTDILGSHEKQSGEGGNYEEPEVSLYAGIQDHGHSYFANSLVYGADLENIMIYGKGLFTGGRMNPETGTLEYVLQGSDPQEPAARTKNGHRGEWYGNKGIALVRCKNIVFRDFSFTIGGHFAIIAEGCENLYAEHILVDTTRDAFDIDCCRDVTVRNTVCNSLTDDGLCLKASFGAGLFMPLENVLLEDCTVSGYDAGSVYAGEYTRDKLAATDRCGPTGRVKFGTESTCGGRLVTIRRVSFRRSRGFCLEAVDCSSLKDVIFEDCTMDEVSSSPIFLRAGDRARFPVTGESATLEYPPAGPDVRLDDKKWVLPNDTACHCYPAGRYAPHYNRTKTVTADGHSFFEIVDPEHPVTCNPANFEERDGRFYLKTWRDGADWTQSADSTEKNGSPCPRPRETDFPPAAGGSLAPDSLQTAGGSLAPDSLRAKGGSPAPDASRAHGFYAADLSREIAGKDLPLYANGIGCEKMASVENVLIRNVTVTNADPRYPVLLMGLTDSHLKNIVLENISIEYRGGLSMEHAVEQRQLNTEWKYSQFHAREQVQSLPWLVNTFFLKNEGLLPRADWDAGHDCWKDDPYNVPELPEVYPEPSNWGILPAYGLFAKHVDGLTLRNIRFSCKVPDERHVCVFDDADKIRIEGLEADCAGDMPPLATVTSHYRRHTNTENVPGQPYFTTTVSGLELLSPPVLHGEGRADGTLTRADGLNPAGSALQADGLAPAESGTCTREPDRAGCLPAQTRWVKAVEINAPAPGTPGDSLYPHPTAPCAETGYSFPVDTDAYPLPLTVHRPFIRPIAPLRVTAGSLCCFTVSARCPASDISPEADSGMIYNEKAPRLNYAVQGRKVPLVLSCENPPQGASFDASKGTFTWTPRAEQAGGYEIIFAVDDGVIPEKTKVKITVEQCPSN